MGFFSKKPPPAPSKPVATWSENDVKTWAKSRGLPKLSRTVLSVCNGPRLIKLQQADLPNLFLTKPPARILNELGLALNDVKARAQMEEAAHIGQSGMAGAQRLPSTDLGSAQLFAKTTLAKQAVSLGPRALTTPPAPAGNMTTQQQLDLRQKIHDWDAAPKPHVKQPTEEEPLSPAAAEQREWEKQQELAHPELLRDFSSVVEDLPLMASQAQQPLPPLQARQHYSTPPAASDDGTRSAAKAADLTQDSTPQTAPVPDVSMNSATAKSTTLGSTGSQADCGSSVVSRPRPSAPPTRSASADGLGGGIMASQYEVEVTASIGSSAHPASMFSELDGGFRVSSGPLTRKRLGISAQKRAVDAGMQQSLREHAENLCKFLPAPANATAVMDFLYPLERTKGLVELCQRSEAAGRLFAAIYDTYLNCFAAICCTQNASRVQDFCLDVACILEAAGKRGLLVPDTLCEELVGDFRRMSDLVGQFAHAGWLLHMAFMQDIKGRFDAVHNEIVRKMQAHHLDTLVQSKTLMTGDYKDPSRSFRRVLKQLGKGSVADGIREVIVNDEYRSKTADVLEVSAADLSAELATFPQSDTSLDVAALYDNLVAGKVAAKINESDLRVVQEVFEWYDQGRKGVMDAADLKSLLLDLGMLDSVKDKDQYVSMQMTMADKDQSRTLSLQEFAAYYSSLVFSGERHQLRTKLGIEAENELKQQFLSFSQYGIRNEVVTEMDGKTFAKYAQDCRLLDGRLRSTTVDLIFCKVKVKGARRIDFDRFLHALSQVAEKKGIAFVDVVSHCLQYEGPATHATRAESTRLHDDRSTYTGVYARGGPTNVEPALDLSQIADRSPADARGVKLSSSLRSWNSPQVRRATSDGAQLHRRMSVGPPQASLHGASLSASGVFASLGSADRPPRAPTPKHTPPARRTAVFEHLNALQTAFASFAMFGKRQAEEELDFRAVKLDSHAFAKLCKDSGLMDSKLSATRVDLLFTKFCDQKLKRMTYKHFLAAIPALAEAKGVEAATVTKTIELCPGPLLKGTIAAPVRWHDDKNLICGVYARGGPSAADNKHSLERIVDRTMRRQSLAGRDPLQSAFR